MFRSLPHLTRGTWVWVQFGQVGCGNTDDQNTPKLVTGIDNQVVYSSFAFTRFLGKSYQLSFWCYLTPSQFQHLCVEIVNFENSDCMRYRLFKIKDFGNYYFWSFRVHEELKHLNKFLNFFQILVYKFIKIWTGFKSFLIVCETDPYVGYETECLYNIFDTVFAESYPSYMWVETHCGNHRQRQCL